MTVRVGINGFGRIGRNFFRAVRARTEAGHGDIEIVGINDLTNTSVLAHLLQYDSILGRLNGTVTAQAGALHVDDQDIITFADRDPKALPGGSLDVEVVVA